MSWCMQFVLSPQPARAHFLKPEERQWLQGRQDAQHKLSAERNPHQGKWWGERPSQFTLPHAVCKGLRTARLPPALESARASVGCHTG